MREKNSGIVDVVLLFIFTSFAYSIHYVVTFFPPHTHMPILTHTPTHMCAYMPAHTTFINSSGIVDFIIVKSFVLMVSDVCIYQTT